MQTAEERVSHHGCYQPPEPSSWIYLTPSIYFVSVIYPYFAAIPAAPLVAAMPTFWDFCPKAAIALMVSAMWNNCDIVLGLFDEDK